MNEEELCEYDGIDKVLPTTEIRKDLKDKPKNKVHFSSGMVGLDRLVDGFMGGELVAITGQTKHGKTLLAQTLTCNFAKQNIRSMWMTFEVPLPQFLEQMPEDVEFYIPRVLKPHNPDWLDERILESKLKYDTRAVFLDHLHYLIDMEKGQKNISVDIGMMIRRLKRTAVRNNIVIFLLCHATKAQDQQGKARELGWQDIRDSSFVGQEADSTIVVTRRTNSDDGDFNDRTTVKVCNHRRTGVMEQKMVVKKVGKMLEEVVLPGDKPSPDTKYFYEKQSDDEPLPF